MTITAMPKKDAAAVPGADEAPPGGKKRKKLLVLVLVVALALAAAWFFVLRPSGAPEAPQPGEVLTLEPIQVNLASGHYLKVGIALQMTSAVKEAPDGSKALDSAIAMFSGRTMEELVGPGKREQLKQQLSDKLRERYDGEVMGVYFTDFVTQ